MLLTVDIGNTNIAYGLFDNEKIVLRAKVATDKKMTSDQHAITLSAVARMKNIILSEIDGAIISSVVPELTAPVKEAVAILTGVNAIVLGPGVKSGLSIRIDNPAQLGADLVAGAVGALEKFQTPCLIIDLGTATKISVIDSSGAFRGCTISAGVGISLSALSGSAALLPDVNIGIEKCTAYGTNTVSSMQTGIILGTAAMLDGMCSRIEESLGVAVKSVVATGGYASDIIKYCKRKISYEPDLIFYGLKTIFEKNT